MGTKFECERLLSRMQIQEIPLEIVEKRTILEFLGSLPLDYLKKLTNFKKIDPKDKKHWGDSREDLHLYKLLKMLNHEQQILLTCKMLIDDGK